MKVLSALNIPVRFKSFILWLLIWVFTGFALGAVILLWPLRIWVNYTRNNHYSDALEKTGVIVFIILLIIISFRISIRLFEWHLTSEKITVTLITILLPFACSAGALCLFLNPDIVNKGTEKVVVSERFTTGPYPTEEKIKQLKEEGFTGIISLLHPAVVPFEPELIKDEEQLANKYHLQLIKAPMLPWVADNTESMKIIEQVVKNGNGRFYIHCYLGKDRVNVAKNLIERLSGKVSGDERNARRTFESQRFFERGDLYKIDSTTYVSPFPTDEEYLSFILAGQVKTVVNIMDSSVAENKPWIEKERKILAPAGIKFMNLIINEKTDSSKMLLLIDSVRALPSPLLIHHWNTTCDESKMFRRFFYYKTHYPQENLAKHETETF